MNAWLKSSSELLFLVNRNGGPRARPYLMFGRPLGVDVFQQIAACEDLLGRKLHREPDVASSHRKHSCVAKAVMNLSLIVLQTGVGDRNVSSTSFSSPCGTGGGMATTTGRFGLLESE